MLDIIKDLDAEKRPEDLMLSYVSGEKGKERSDRELVTLPSLSSSGRLTELFWKF